MTDDSEVMEELLQALDNEKNDSIMGMTSQRIQGAKNDILQRLQIKG